jgi:hypothetical protein
VFIKAPLDNANRAATEASVRWCFWANMDDLRKEGCTYRRLESFDAQRRSVTAGRPFVLYGAGLRGKRFGSRLMPLSFRVVAAISMRA